MDTVPPEFEFARDSLGIANIKREDVRSLVGLARYLGSRIELSPGGGFLLIFPHKTIAVPITGLRDSKYKSMLHQVVRHADADHVVRWADSSRATFIDKLSMPPGRMEIIDQVVAERATQLVEELGLRPTIVAEREPDFPPNYGTQSKYVLTRTPWVASKGQQSGYESPAVDEVQYSDGTTRYACRWRGCEETFDNPKSCSVHYGRHRRGEGRQPNPPADLPRNPNTPIIHGERRAQRIKELEAELYAARKELGPATTLTEMAEWIIDQRIAKQIDGEDTIEVPSPLTPEQVLTRIGHLLDRMGHSDLESRIAVLENDVRQAEDNLKAAQARAQRAEGALSALRDLISESIPQPDKDN